MLKKIKSNDGSKPEVASVAKKVGSYKVAPHTKHVTPSDRAKYIAMLKRQRNNIL